MNSVRTGGASLLAVGCSMHGCGPSQDEDTPTPTHVPERKVCVGADVHEQSADGELWLEKSRRRHGNHRLVPPGG